MILFMLSFVLYGTDGYLDSYGTPLLGSLQHKEQVQAPYFDDVVKSLSSTCVSCTSEQEKLNAKKMWEDLGIQRTSDNQNPLDQLTKQMQTYLLTKTGQEKENAELVLYLLLDYVSGRLEDYGKSC